MPARNQTSPLNHKQFLMHPSLFPTKIAGKSQQAKTINILRINAPEQFFDMNKHNQCAAYTDIQHSSVFNVYLNTVSASIASNQLPISQAFSHALKNKLKVPKEDIHRNERL